MLVLYLAWCSDTFSLQFGVVVLGRTIICGSRKWAWTMNDPGQGIWKSHHQLMAKRPCPDLKDIIIRYSFHGELMVCLSVVGTQPLNLAWEQWHLEANYGVCSTPPLLSGLVQHVPYSVCWGGSQTQHHPELGHCVVVLADTVMKMVLYFSDLFF